MDIKSFMLKDGKKVITTVDGRVFKSFMDIDGKDKLIVDGVYYEYSVVNFKLIKSIYQPDQIITSSK